jgi:hypothetical protein
MSKIKYNGYTDLNTWRVLNDTLSGIDFESKVTADELKEISLDIVLSNFEMKRGSHLVEDYARLFIELADFEDIAEAINFNKCSLKRVLMERDGMTGIDADLEIKDIKIRVMQCGENPETILFDEYGLEPDYIWDLI